jgi:tetratricopeptide (TPR) repeat protein
MTVASQWGETMSQRDAEAERLLRTVAEAVKPFKAGSLENISFSQLLVYLESRSLTGSLWLYDRHQDSTVSIVRGAPAKVRTTLEVPTLGQVLMDLGHIDQRMNDETLLFAQRGGGLHGAVLMACGLLDKAALEEGLRHQTARRLIEIIRTVGSSTRFAFYRDVDLLVSWGGVETTRIDPWWLMWMGNRERKADRSVRSVLEALGRERVVIRSDADLDRFGFDDGEREFLFWWSERPAAIGRLLVYPRLPKERIAHLVAVLFLTNNLAYHDAAAGESQRPPESVPAKARNRAPASRPVQETPAPAKERMKQAYQSVIEPVERQHDQPAPKRNRTHSELDLSRCAEALRLSKLSLDALGRGQFEKAEQLGSQALALMPANAALKTEYAWVASHLPARRKIGDLGDLLDLLREATEAEPALDRAYFVRGTILEHLGLHQNAYAEYRAAFARNPRNVEAAAKLRDYVQRIKRFGTPDPGARKPDQQGVFARLWKRD